MSKLLHEILRRDNLSLPPEEPFKHRVHFGVEFEIEEFRGDIPQVLLRRFDQHEEGSLRSGRGRSIELVTQRGKTPAQLAQDLMILSRKLDDPRQQFTLSYRTALHVHVNYLDASPEVIYNSAMLYVMFEPYILSMIDDDRKDNVFARTIQCSHPELHMFSLLANPKAIRTFSEYYGRYSALNLNALSKHGTIEYRLNKCTVKFPELIKWIDIYTGFRTAAEYMTKNNLSMYQIIKDYSQVADIIFGRNIPRSQIAEGIKLVIQSISSFKN